MDKGKVPECASCKVRTTCFFSTLGPEDFDEFSRARISNVYKKRQVVFYEGHIPHGVYIVCRGRVKVYKTDQRGHQLITRIANPGGLLGYRALLAREPYSGSTEAFEESTISYIGEEVFLKYTSRSPALANRLLTQLSKDVRNAEDRARDLAMKSSRERLAQILLMLKTAYGRPEKQGTLIEVPFTRLDLAELAGLAQETAIRLLGELEEKKIIALKGRTIAVLDEKALQRYSTQMN
jgi:CRP-like cAMP-binding protein